MTNYVFSPTYRAPSSSSWQLITNTKMFVSPLSGAIQVVQRPGARFAANISWEGLHGVDRDELIAFFARLNGPLNTFDIWDASHTFAGAATDPITVSGAGQTGSTLNIHSATEVSVADFLVAGTRLSLPGTAQYCMVAADTDLDGSGNAAVPVIPALRDSPTNGGAITYLSQVPCRMRLAADPEWTNADLLAITTGRSPGMVSDLSIVAVESI